MIIADKIVSLRKRAGWSQEELAEKLGVTRQSVSKWEGAQSVPDMDKVVSLSRLFGVTTDYLLKDELEEDVPCAAAEDNDPPLRRVTMGQASAYLALRKAAAPKVAAATALCIVSPVTLLLLSALSESGRFGISGNAAAGIGLCVLLVLVAVAVSLFLRTAAQVREFKFLEEEPFETEYGVDGMVRQRQQEYKDTNTRLTTVGVVLCVLAAVPLFAVMCIDGADLLYVGAVCALLALVAVGCLALVTTGVYQGAMEQLLEEGDYTRPQKKHHKLRGTVTMIYWLAATAVFLLYTYGPKGNGQPQYSWIIWAVAGVLYAAVMGIVFGLVIVLAVEFFDKVAKIDDPVGAISVHGVCGALGTILTGLFATGVSTEKGVFYGGGFHFFGVQCLGVASVILYVAVVITIVFAILKHTIGLRVTPEEEITGLDVSEHGLLTAYAGFAMLPDTAAVETDAPVAVTGSVPAAEAIPVKRVPSFDTADGTSPKFTKVEIICKESKFEALKTAMLELGITGMTMSHVLGCGIQKGKPEYYRGVEVEPTLLPKIQLDIVVSKVPVRSVIETAKKVLYTGHIGDGKIFVYDVENVVKVRTGEEGYDALQDVE